MKNKNVMLAILILTLGLLIGEAYIIFSKNSNSAENKESSANKITSTNYKTEEVPVLTSWQEEWINYESKFGVSFKYPKFVTGKGCNSKSEVFYVPTKILEDTDDQTIYIMPEYYYDEDESHQTCKKYITSLDSLRKEASDAKETLDAYKPFLGWRIVTKNVENKNEIDSMIKNIYGPGCKIKSEKAWIKNGINEITLNSYEDAEGNSTSLDQTICPTSYVYKILNSGKRVVSVILGQECTFEGDNHNKCLDDQIIKSFELK